MRKKEKSKKIKPGVIIIFIIGLLIGYHTVDFSIDYKITNDKLVKIIFKNTLPTTEKELIYKVLKEQIETYYKDTVNLLNINLRNEVPSTVKKEIPVIKEETTNNLPLIYLYNSHQTEEYETSSILDFSIKPTVMIGNYILEEIFNKNNYSTFVEENSIKEILNQNNWKYSYSYAASRKLLEERKKEHPSLKYYIDIHRDSLEKGRTTVEINGKQYAKLIFLIGLENKNYQANLEFTTKINDLLNIKYPSLSKGIYKKGGQGVNGVYNQDFSPYLILLEVGGYQNTPIEVLNSLLAFSECYMEVIKEYENK